MDAVRTILLGAVSGALVAAIGVGAWVYVYESPPSASPSNALTAIVEPVAALEVGEVSGIHSPGVLPAPNRLPTHPPVSAESMLEQGARQSHETSTRLEAIWSADKANPMQTRHTEQALVAAMSSEGLLEVPEQPGRVVDIGCRASMCRIESEFPAGYSGAEWATRLLIGAAPEFGTSTFVTLPSEGGANKFVIYAFKLGKDPRK